MQQCLQLVVDPVDKVDEIRKARIDRALVEIEELVPPQSQTRVGARRGWGSEGWIHEGGVSGGLHGGKGMREAAWGSSIPPRSG